MKYLFQKYSCYLYIGLDKDIFHLLILRLTNYYNRMYDIFLFTLVHVLQFSRFISFKM
jgi:hypothetical protein